MSAALIDARDLHTYYDDSHILRGVSLRLRAGETVGLMGRNGMGKSTLIRTLMGLVKPRRGSILIDGRDMTGAATFRIARTGIAYVPEGRGIFASLRVAENLSIAARPGIDGSVAWDIPRVLQLFPRLAERIGNGGDQLSGGEQQMLAIRASSFWTKRRKGWRHSFATKSGTPSASCATAASRRCWSTRRWPK